MKVPELAASVVFVAIVASLVTVLSLTIFPKRGPKEGFEDPDPDTFTPSEEAKLKLLRDKSLFVADGKGVTVNMPVWVEKELRITNADPSPKNGALRLKRQDGKTVVLSIPDKFQADLELFTQARRDYFMLPEARDLVITNGDGTEHRLQPYSVGYKSPSSNKYIPGYPKDPVTGKTVATVFKNLQDAYRECDRIVTLGGQCGGVTKAANGTYTLRKGDRLIQSPYGETSMQRY